jgi:hypothetical protein
MGVKLGPYIVGVTQAEGVRKYLQYAEKVVWLYEGRGNRRAEKTAQ